MVWATASFDRFKYLLIFIDAGGKVNSEVYVEMLDKKVLCWITEVFGGYYIFTQDRAPEEVV